MQIGSTRRPRHDRRRTRSRLLSAVEPRQRKISRRLAENLVRLAKLMVLALPDFQRSRSSVVGPSRLPLSRSDCRSQRHKVSALQTIFAANEEFAALCETCLPRAPAPCGLRAPEPRANSSCSSSCLQLLHPQELESIAKSGAVQGFIVVMARKSRLKRIDSVHILNSSSRASRVLQFWCSEFRMRDRHK